MQLALTKCEAAWSIAEFPSSLRLQTINNPEKRHQGLQSVGLCPGEVVTSPPEQLMYMLMSFLFSESR